MNTPDTQAQIEPTVRSSELLAAAGQCEALALKVEAEIKIQSTTQTAIHGLNTKRCVLWQAAVYLQSEAEAANDKLTP